MFSRATQCVRGVLDPPVSAFSLSLYRHPFLYTLFSSRFTLIIKKQRHWWLKNAGFKLVAGKFIFRSPKIGGSRKLNWWLRIFCPEIV
jgi:hypothetical protein